MRIDDISPAYSRYHAKYARARGVLRSARHVSSLSRMRNSSNISNFRVLRLGVQRNRRANARESTLVYL